MAYMEHPVYAYRDDTHLHLHDPDGDRVTIALETFDELVAMRWAQLTAEERRLVATRAAEAHVGFGADALRHELGLPTALFSLLDGRLEPPPPTDGTDA